ncbi:MAG: M23 family metallopeptidase [Gemmatimonadota bacterium]
MRGGLTPAWTVILVPPTPRASPRRVGVKMRTVRVLAMLAIAMLIPALALSWSWMDTQSTTTQEMAARLVAQEQLMATLNDSLDTYRRATEAVRATRLPPPNMIMPVGGRITSWFSRARKHPILRISRPHRGIDVAAPSGTRIVAPATGIVASVKRAFGFGLTVELVHSGNVVTRYAHLRSAVVKAGDRVTMGQPIATVGSSGLSTGPHLHFEVLVSGTAVDPVAFLAATRKVPVGAAGAKPLSARPVSALLPAGAEQ